ncbi:MAG TPA: glycosyltransferase, partial [Burkholderiales bacterium]|nr:glycosyltransferase [Burkholderiales bacterium]
MEPLTTKRVAGRRVAAALEAHNNAAPHYLAVGPRVAVLIPCYNEACTVAEVVTAFRAVLPSAIVYVYDNNSTDDTAAKASAAGAIVRTEPLQGKGNVIRRMFADIDADIYVLVDGDGTYDAASAPRMIDRLLDDDLDMVNAARDEAEDNA